MRTAIINKAGLKIGFIGIAEREWINILQNLEVDLIYTNYKRCATEYAKKLREVDNCDMVIALTHMRVNHDEKFAREVPGIDLVLGGHDHEYYCLDVKHELKAGGGVENKHVPIVKSATDYRDMSEIDITFKVPESEFNKFKTSQQTSDSERTKLIYSPADQTQFVVNRIRLADGDWAPEPECAKVEAHYQKDFQEKMGHTVGYVGVDLETRDSIIRRQETNYGNMICDLLRTEYFTDFAIANSGSFRKNAVIPAGEFSLMMI